MKYVIGIDPGKSGGMALMGNGFVSAVDSFTNMSETDIVAALRRYIDAGVAGVWLEQVHAMPGQGVSSMFSFGESLGFVKGIIVALGIPRFDVRPQVWQKALGKLPPSGPDRKRALKEIAQRRYPQVKVTLANCDAILIAEYGVKQQSKVVDDNW